MPTFLLFALALAPAFASAEPSGANNSRLAVTKALAGQYGAEASGLRAELRSADDAGTTHWLVTGRAAGRRVQGLTSCRRTLFYYNKYDRAFRAECRVTRLSLR